MRKSLFLCLLLTALSLKAQEVRDLTIQTRIDSVYVFAYDLSQSRSTKGAIWNLQTGKAETPQSYTSLKTDTINGTPVVMLYREVVRGNHPLNGWETWVREQDQWVRSDDETENNEQ